jgi:hypothetical protein
MITQDSPDVYGYTIFCDDIRVEVGNKLTFVGTYTSALIAHGTFPFVMPKLALHVVYMQRHPNVIPPSKFMIFLPEATGDEPSFQFDIPPEAAEQAIVQASQQYEMSPDENVYAAMGLQFGILNLIISQPGRIRVRAVRGDSLIRLGSLTVIPGLAQSPAANPATP